MKLYEIVARATDTKIQKIQGGIVKGATAALKALDLVFVVKADFPKEHFETTCMSTRLSDTLNILGFSNLLSVQKRKEFLRSDIRPEFRALCSPASASTPQQLFGTDVIKKVTALVRGRVGSVPTILPSEAEAVSTYRIPTRLSVLF